MKKKILLCACIALCLSIVAYGTLAYFSYQDTATNVLTTGNVKIDLQELALSEDGGELVPFDDAIDAMPGTEASKIVQIQNIGGQAAWVRISLDQSIALAEDAEGTADPSLISYDLNTEHWSEKDGWYYYNIPLQPGTTTEPLFTKVVFSATMGNMYQQSKVFIEVGAQATQWANNGASVLEAAGWPNAQ